MNTIRPCGCKGIRTCLKCEADFDIKKPKLYDVLQNLDAWSYCPACDKLYHGWDAAKILTKHPHHIDKEESIDFPGVLVQENFLTNAEGKMLIENLDTLPWDISQSGRRKQNFGPKTNFKKRKLQNGKFNGFPAFTKFIQERFNDIVLLNKFQSIEQCSIEYDPTKGASIDPHIDDCWIWGERVVTVNCLGDAILTLTLYDDENDANINDKKTPNKKFNLDLVQKYKEELLMPLNTEENLKKFKNRVIRIPMANLSLVVLYGPARYQFEHLVLREDILERRVCIAYREFTPMYLENGEENEKGSGVIANAKNFWQEMT